MLQTCFSFSVVLSLATLSAGDMNQTKPRVETRVLENTKWETKEVPVFFPGKTEPNMTEVKSSVFVYEHKFNHFNPVKVTQEEFEIWVLQIPEQKLTWIGTKQDWMVFAENEIVGVRFLVGWAPFLVWSEAMPLPGFSRSGKEPVEDISSILKENATFTMFQHANWTALEVEEKVKRSTSLNCLKPGFSSANPSGAGQQIGKIELVDFDVTNSKLHLKLHNQTLQRTGEIWVDIKTRKVVKAMEDGDITFPRQQTKE
ncbi:hypothetical protein OAK91_05325 [Planctomycetaceae bacterium]|jgi:hypothetical protein|nr:hypothetical protein [Planctomycetaceae bacterium]MDC0274133.1 hypothetical protein [Planctomycetaceae bacterium]